MNNKKSLGKLRKATKTKPLSPDLVGKIHVQSEHIAAIMNHLNEKGSDEVVCNIAAWTNRDASGQYLSVQLSPPYVPQQQQPQPENNLDFIFGDEEEV
jgi:hypothetical protein